MLLQLEFVNISAKESLLTLARRYYHKFEGVATFSGLVIKTWVAVPVEQASTLK
jgi:hypothetical protein